MEIAVFNYLPFKQEKHSFVRSLLFWVYKGLLNPEIVLLVQGN